MKRLIVSLLLLGPATLAFAGQDEDFDSLGGNQILLEKAKALNPETVTSIVQSRTVSRRNRFELAPEYSGTFGGDTYSRTQSLGMNVHFHLTPRWSIGAKYNHSFNRLTAEGEEMVDRAYQDFLNNPKASEAPIPELDYQKSEMMALVNWYPVYGKINLLDKAVAQFDGYLVGGAGQVELKSGSTSTYTLGAGVGFWLSPRFSTRVEMRYQRYEAQYLTGPKNLDLAVASMQMGWLL